MDPMEYLYGLNNNAKKTRQEKEQKEFAKRVAEHKKKNQTMEATEQLPPHKKTFITPEDFTSGPQPQEPSPEVDVLPIPPQAPKEKKKRKQPAEELPSLKTARTIPVEETPEVKTVEDEKKTEEEVPPPDEPKPLEETKVHVIKIEESCARPLIYINICNQ